MYLFFVYGILIVSLLGTFFLYFYHYYSGNLYAEAKRNSENFCASISSSINSELDNMTGISMNIVYSNAIKSNFIEFSNTHQYSKVNLEDFWSSRESSLAIFDIITAIIGPFQSASQVNLYTFNGYCVGSGYYQRVKNVQLEDYEWYKPTMDLQGHRYFSSLTIHKDFPAQGENLLCRKFISLTRLFFNKAEEPEGIVEVIQDCGKIFSLIPELVGNSLSASVYVYNERGELVYPYASTTTENYLSLIKENDLSPSNGKMIPAIGNKKDQILLTYKVIDNYGWTVVSINPKSAIYSSINQFRNTFIIIITLSIILTLAICFFISGRLTRPLSKLTNATKKITINRVLDERKVILTSADSSITEISQLCESIREMYEKLRSTSQDVLLSHSEETKAKLRATQSLINPHFLYNCLTNISIMAEENMNDDIISMCYSLCDYFRYISSSEEMIVPLKDEIYSTEKYLHCMQMRYKNDFEYIRRVNPDAEDVLIPKLIIQPIVENAFKYAFDKTPPWQLQITARIEGNHWIIEIQDNGGCLTDDRKNYLMNLYETLNIKEEYKSLQIGGMGLKNVYLRMKLLYGDKAIFKIENTYPKRTIFILGGPIYKTKEEYYEHYHKL